MIMSLKCYAHFYSVVTHLYNDYVLSVRYCAICLIYCYLLVIFRWGTVRYRYLSCSCSCWGERLQKSL